MSESIRVMIEENSPDTSALTPYLRLWAAKLLMHKKDYDRIHTRGPRSYATKKAEHWFFIDDSHAVGTFAWICAIFNKDVDLVRTRIQPKWRTMYRNKK